MAAGLRLVRVVITGLPRAAVLISENELRRDVSLKHVIRAVEAT